MTTDNKKTKSAKPAYIAYQVRDGKGEKGFFTRIGVAFPHADGQGLNILLDAIPLGEHLECRNISGSE